jgi:hypothetical protein
MTAAPLPMTRRLGIALDRPRGRSWAVVVAGLALVAAWPAFVFTGSQVAYLGAAVAAAVVSLELARARSVLAVALLIAVLTLIGPEANGALGRGDAPLGTLRLLDITLASALLGVCFKPVEWVDDRRDLLRLAAGAAARSPAAWLLALLLTYSVALWAAYGPSLDGFVKTDVRLVALGFGTFVLTAVCRRGGAAPLVAVLIALAPWLLLKTAAIDVADLFVIGTYDRAQASLAQSRVILLGGDTLLILTPALTVLASRRWRARAPRVGLGLCAAASFGALLFGATRTSILVALGLAVLVSAIIIVAAGRRPSLGAVALGLAALVFAGTGLAVTGAGERFLRKDAPHVGINFRHDEMKALLRIDDHKLIVGQGIGGTFPGKDVRGRIVDSGWAHSTPAWVALKLGLPGVALVSVLLLILGGRTIKGLRDPGRRWAVSVGATMVFGLLMMSLTLGRAALPEGVVFLAVGIALVVMRPVGMVR